METCLNLTLKDDYTVDVPPSGGSLEIGNGYFAPLEVGTWHVPPSGGSLEIGNCFAYNPVEPRAFPVPPSGGSLEIGNVSGYETARQLQC